MGPESARGLSGGGVCASKGVIDRIPPASPSGRAAQAVHAVVAQAQAAQFAQARGGGGSTRVRWKEPNKNQNDGRAPVGVQWPAASRRSGSGGSWPRDASSCDAWRLSARRRGTPNAAAANPSNTAATWTCPLTKSAWPPAAKLHDTP